VLPGEVRGHRLACGRAEALELAAVEQPLECRCQCEVIVGRHEDHALTGRGDVLRPTLALSADRRQAGPHGLDVGHAKGLLHAGHDERVAPACLGQRLLVLELAEETHAIAHPQLRGEPLEWVPAGPVTDHDVVELERGAQLSQRVQHDGVTFARHQVGDGDERRPVMT
jgi:hypothetical protein